MALHLRSGFLRVEQSQNVAPEVPPAAVAPEYDLFNDFEYLKKLRKENQTTYAHIGRLTWKLKLHVSRYPSSVIRSLTCQILLGSFFRVFRRHRQNKSLIGSSGRPKIITEEVEWVLQEKLRSADLSLKSKGFSAFVQETIQRQEELEGGNSHLIGKRISDSSIARLKTDFDVWAGTLKTPYSATCCYGNLSSHFM